MIDLYQSLLVSVLQTELYVLTQGLAFLLCQRCHDGQQNLSLRIHCVDILFFKEYRNVLLFKLPDVFQAVQRVSGKSANRLCNDHVDFPSHALFDHSGMPSPM